MQQATRGNSSFIKERWEHLRHERYSSTLTLNTAYFPLGPQIESFWTKLWLAIRVQQEMRNEYKNWTGKKLGRCSFWDSLAYGSNAEMKILRSKNNVKILFCPTLPEQWYLHCVPHIPGDYIGDFQLANTFLKKFSCTSYFPLRLCA
jgi:hypothetical protein